MISPCQSFSLSVTRERESANFFMVEREGALNFLTEREREHKNFYERERQNFTLQYITKLGKKLIIAQLCFHCYEGAHMKLKFTVE